MGYGLADVASRGAAVGRFLQAPTFCGSSDVHPVPT